MTENLIVPHLPQRDLTPIAVGEKVFHGVQPSTEKAICLPEVSTFSSPRPATVVDTRLECAPDVGGRGVPAPVLSSHVVLRARLAGT